MDQEKIGKFIARLRKDRKMTQQELAMKLGVTDKAISKWENGRCLMDISMLKPLSECLGVTIMELINGEEISSEERISRTDDTIEKTIGYVNVRVRMIVKSIMRVLLGVILGLLFLFGLFLYKTYCAYVLYYVYESDYYVDDESYNLIYNCLNNGNAIDIYSSGIDNDLEYLILDNLMIRNDFINFERIDNDENNYGTFVNYDSNEVISFNFRDTYVDNFKTYSYSLSRGDTKERREEFLLENGISNDIDLFNYIGDNFYIENWWFNSIDKLRNNYMINEFMLDNIIRDVDGCIKIRGMYDGYIYSYSYNDTSGNLVNMRVIEIFDDGGVYEISFIGDKYKNDEYMVDLLSTLIIK